MFGFATVGAQGYGLWHWRFGASWGLKDIAGLEDIADGWIRDLFGIE